MAKIITIYNRKGGVAKTITSFVLAWYMAQKGLRVLVIDADSQANLTKRLLTGDKPSNHKLGDIILSGLPISPADVRCRKIDAEHQIDFVEGSLNFTNIEGKLPDGVPKEFFLVDLLSGIGTKYDYIIIDTPPSAELASTASLMAANEVIIPCTADTLGLEGVGKTLPIVERIGTNPRANPSLHVAGILVTKYPTHRCLTAEKAMDALKEAYGDKVISTYIREGNLVEKALMQNLPVIAYNPNYYVSADYIAAINVMFPSL